TLASAWGIAQSLRAAGVPVRLKWPNDLVLAGRKLGGILTESRISAARLTWSVIGVGINWANPVPANGIGLKSFPMPLNADGIDSLERLAAAVLMGIVSGYYRCQHPDRAQFVADYEKLLINLGQMVQLPDEQSGHLGKVVGVSSRGNLRLRALVKSLGNSSAAALTERSSEIEYQPGAIALGYNT
ncbi:MAG: biotin--[acetyl-CoA-carboxylase] ligase, partial [Cyanobacteria bacterium P01_H01_bin.119]